MGPAACARRGAQGGGRGRRAPRGGGPVRPCSVPRRSVRGDPPAVPGAAAGGGGDGTPWRHRPPRPHQDPPTDARRAVTPPPATACGLHPPSPAPWPTVRARQVQAAGGHPPGGVSRHGGAAAPQGGEAAAPPTAAAAIGRARRAARAPGADRAGGWSAAVAVAEVVRAAITGRVLNFFAVRHTGARRHTMREVSVFHWLACWSCQRVLSARALWELCMTRRILSTGGVVSCTCDERSTAIDVRSR